ncbi:MAG TPA: 2-oxo acid dehydrogenase subunit E2 [Actinomycetota bacterium]|nr:2-oxo acid dehydrogenase subunit E2 [Actinomycetota bacterium]
MTRDRARTAPTTGWRRIATAVWRWPRDPQIYGRLEVDAEPIVHAVERLRETTGERVTITHVVVKALAMALRDNPSVNSRLRRGRFVPRADVDVFVILATGEGNDLSGVKVGAADTKSIPAIAREIAERARKARDGAGGDIDKGKRLLAVLPLTMRRIALRMGAFLTSDLGIDLARYGLPRDAFGGAMVSSVGMFGITEGWAPLSPIYRVPLLILIGQIESKAVVRDGVVVAGRVLPITATIDHRWVDGEGISSIVRTFRSVLADPLAHESTARIARGA